MRRATTMTTLSILMVWAASGLRITAADPPTPAPVLIKVVKFPEFTPLIPPVVTPPNPPSPKADPAAPVALAKGQFYVIASPDPLLILTEGSGDVGITERKPPFMLPAEQAIGWKASTTDPEFVTWGAESPFLYVMKPVKSGDVKLIVLPATSKSDPTTKNPIPIAKKDVVYKLLAVDDGTGPRPPPKPTVDPPVPKPDGTKDLRVMFVYDSEASLTKEQLNIMGSTKLVTWLNTNCVKDIDERPAWRKWDKDIDKRDDLKFETATWKKLWTDTKPNLGTLPQVVIVVGQSGQIYPWPETEDKMIAFLKDKSGRN